MAEVSFPVLVSPPCEQILSKTHELERLCWQGVVSAANAKEKRPLLAGKVMTSSSDKKLKL